MEDLGNGDCFPGLGSCSCLGLVECGAERNWPSHLTLLQPSLPRGSIGPLAVQGQEILSVHLHPHSLEFLR